MLQRFFPFVTLLVGGGAALLVGCEQNSEPARCRVGGGVTRPEERSVPRAAAAHDRFWLPQAEAMGSHSGSCCGGRRNTTSDLMSLEGQDRELAEKQKVCPVSGAPLGSMGTPATICHPSAR